MFKTGITTLNELQHGSDKTLFRKELKHTSITLYDQIMNEPNAQRLAERILLLFADDKGAYKRTYSHRFDSFDHTVVQIAKQRLPNQKDIIIQDVGVSDARTSIDFFEKIAPLFPNMSYTASDYSPDVYVIEKGKTKITMSSSGKILEIMRAPFVFNTIKRDSYRHYPINHLIRKWIEWFVVASIMKDYANGGLKSKKLLMFCPAAVELEQTNQHFRLLKHNILDPIPRQSHMIRVMNVLNVSYFSDDQMTQIIKNMFEGLIEGGLFISGSNQEADSMCHGSVYQKTLDGFEKIWQSGEGSPIEHYLPTP